MASGSTRKWFVRVGLGLVIVAAAAGIWAGTHVATLKTYYAAFQLRSANSDEERKAAADNLASLGQPGLAKLVDITAKENDPCRTVAAGALDRLLVALPDGDSRAIVLATHVFDVFLQSDESGRRVLLGLLPNIMKRTGNTFAAKCRDAIILGLKMPEADSRVLAIRLALHPDLRMRKELLPLLNDAEARVRASALFALSSVSDDELAMGDEELFRWLHDPDESVRNVCYDALVSRNRSEVEISLARRLSNPDPGERLKLLYDLRYEDEVADPEPWLERLSRDRDPAVRVGAARVVLEVMAERKQRCPAWLSRITDADPDPTVRRVASFFRRELAHTGEVRPARAP